MPPEHVADCVVAEIFAVYSKSSFKSVYIAF